MTTRQKTRSTITLPQSTKKDACDVGAVRLTARPTTGSLYRPGRAPTNPASAWTHVPSHYTIRADMGLFPDVAGAPAAPLIHNGCEIYAGTCSWADPSF